MAVKASLQLLGLTMGKNSYKQAVSDCKQVHKLNSRSVDAYIIRALTYHRQGNYQQAISNYSRALKLTPNSTKAYSNRAAAYNEQKDYQKAIADSIATAKVVKT